MSGWLKRLLGYPHPLRYYLYKRGKARFWPDPLPSYRHRIRAGQVERAHYGYCICEAALLARTLGHPVVSLIEFGVASGNGLINIERHAESITAETGVTFEIYGFDLETGLPRSGDYRDAPYGWGPGFYAMDRGKLQGRLNRAKLIIGDVRETVPGFISTHRPAPIGAVMFDLDYYTSTKHALAIFEEDPRHYLPRVQCSFDDVNTIEFAGELAAIREFNDANTSKKIGKIFAGQPGWIKGGEKIYEFHDFRHPDYMRPTYHHTDGHMPLRD